MVKIPTSVYLPIALYQEVMQVSRMTKVPYAEIARQALTLWLEKRRAGHRTTLREFDETGKTPNSGKIER